MTFINSQQYTVNYFYLKLKALFLQKTLLVNA